MSRKLNIPSVLVVVVDAPLTTTAPCIGWFFSSKITPDTLAVTSIICMLSYKYFVRGTLIGIFLNGKVHKNNDQQKVK